jgi:hypothetical protein
VNKVNAMALPLISGQILTLFTLSSHNIIWKVAFMELEKAKISEKLRNHLTRLYLDDYINVDQIEAFHKIIHHLLYNYACEEKEFSYINSGKSKNPNIILKKEGTRNHVEFSDEDIEKIDNEDLSTLTVIHNHPNSTALSYDDFTFFIIHGSVQNMIAFGVIGNLYFAQKADPELYLNYSGIGEKNALKKELEDTFTIITIKYLKGIYPNYAPKTSWEIISHDSDENDKFFSAIIYEYFKKTCEDNNLRYYPRTELNLNGK